MDEMARGKSALMRKTITREMFDKMSPITRSALWPRCEFCHHIAEAHDTHISEPKENSCCEWSRGQCPTCGIWSEKVPCICQGYRGPKSVEELLLLLSESK